MRERTISLKQEPKTVFRELDQVLVRADQTVALYGAATPGNWQNERERFLSGKTAEPSFTYTTSRAVEQQIQGLQDELRRYQDVLRNSPLPDDQMDALREYYLDTIGDTLRRTDIVLNIGEQKMVRHTSQQLWGVPADRTLKLAYDILDGDAAILDELRDSADQETQARAFRQALEDMFQAFDLSEWRTAYTQKTTHVSPVEKCVRINAGRNGILDSCQNRLLLHEFGVHVLRAANGWQQPYDLFAVGLHDYEITEEGITTYLEYLTGLLSEQQLRQYALRVLAVQSVLNYDRFPETFAMLAAYTDDETAFRTTMRAHRGGGLVKDHIYLQGFLRIREHVERENGLDDLEDLYMGKIGLDQLDELRNLRNAGHLEPAKHGINNFLHHFRTHRLLEQM